MEKIVADLKEMRDSTDTALQYHIWTELIDDELANAQVSPLRTQLSQGVWHIIS